jgi:exopolysaccharide biosynthesis polyprenyl glycosylphosphotransferase
MTFLWDHSLLIDWVDTATVLGQGLAISLCCVASFYYSDLYDLRLVWNLRAFASRLFRSSVIAFILLAVLYFFFYTFFPHTKITKWPFIASLLMAAGFLLPIRAICYSLMKRPLLAERVLIMGTSPLAAKIAEGIESAPHLRYKIIGVADNVLPSCETMLAYPFLGALNELPKIVEELKPERIIVALAERRGQLPVDYLLRSRADGVAIEDGVAFYERLTGKLAIETLTPGNLIFSQDLHKLDRIRALRRMISLIASMLGLVGLAPLLGLIALAIKLDSRGPVFFIQPRLGLKARRFNLIKFRTMHPSNGGTSEWVRDNSDRITPVGAWLRKFRLDELPQLINILRGDMNFVGPRPHPVSNHQLFVQNIPYYCLRSVIRPGVTGWAQIRYGYANDLEEETEKMRYDLYYIKHMSVWLDLWILFETVRIVLGHGEAAAYRTATPGGRERAAISAVGPHPTSPGEAGG